MPSLEPRCIGTLNKNQAPAYLVTAYSNGQSWWPTGLFQYYTAAVQCYELCTVHYELREICHAVFADFDGNIWRQFISRFTTARL